MAAARLNTCHTPRNLCLHANHPTLGPAGHAKRLATQFTVPRPLLQTAVPAAPQHSLPALVHTKPPHPDPARVRDATSLSRLGGTHTGAYRSLANRQYTITQMAHLWAAASPLRVATRPTPPRAGSPLPIAWPQVVHLPPNAAQDPAPPEPPSSFTSVPRLVRQSICLPSGNPRMPRTMDARITTPHGLDETLQQAPMVHGQPCAWGPRT